MNKPTNYNTRKQTVKTVLTTIAAIAMSTSAWATCANGASDWPACNHKHNHSHNTPPAATNPQPITNTANGGAGGASEASAAAGAAAGAVAGSQSGAASRSGDVTGSNSAQGGSLTEQNRTDVRALAISLPAPSAVPALPSPHDCIGSAGSAKAVGWNFASTAKNGQMAIKECMIGQQIIMLRSACQFGAANMLQARLVSDLSGVVIEPAVDRNLTEEECRSRLVVTPPAERVVYVPAPVTTQFIDPAAAKKAAIKRSAPIAKVQTCKAGLIL